MIIKIKIIDILNKIANGEDVPKKIKYNNIIYEYRGYMYCTENPNYQDIEDYLFGKWNFNILNDEVEILEITITHKQDKKIEKVKNKRGFTKNQRRIIHKINEIIDKVNNE